MVSEEILVDSRPDAGRGVEGEVFPRVSGEGGKRVPAHRRRGLVSVLKRENRVKISFWRSHSSLEKLSLIELSVSS